MQKIFLINRNQHSVQVIKEIENINDFIRETGSIISITPNNIHGLPNSSAFGDWLVVAESDDEKPELL
jgi:hypothetical protein